MSASRVMIVGNPDEVHVGRHLRVAAGELGVPVELVDVRGAFGGNRALSRLLWHWDRRPAFLGQFSRHVVAKCGAFKPSVVIATGVCPVNAESVSLVQNLGARIVNFSTDDPFNRAHRARWFLRALPRYDVVFSPRRTNLDDLARVGCRVVRYLPFGSAPDQHYREGQNTDGDMDLVFVGGADAERLPLISSLLSAGLRVALYGGYWDRHAQTRAAHRGFAGAAAIRRATGSSRVCLILVRRANRDGHVMRSFEAAACGGCLLVEDTPEHREVFADTVTYFRNTSEMIERARRLVDDPSLRRRTADASHRRITVEGRNTYADRLQTILDTTLRT